MMASEREGYIAGLMVDQGLPKPLNVQIDRDDETLFVNVRVAGNLLTLQADARQTDEACAADIVGQAMASSTAS